MRFFQQPFEIISLQMQIFQYVLARKFSVTYTSMLYVCHMYLSLDIHVPTYVATCSLPLTDIRFDVIIWPMQYSSAMEVVMVKMIKGHEL